MLLCLQLVLVTCAALQQPAKQRLKLRHVQQLSAEMSPVSQERFVAPAQAFAATAASTWLTWRLASHLGVFASSGAVGLAAARLLPAPAAAAAFCGSFAGMCGSGVAASGAEILFLGVFCATAQNVCAASLPGVGGRLGVVALGSTLCWQATKTLLSHGPLLSFVPQHLAWHVLAWQLPAAALLSTAAALGVKKLSQTQGIVFSAGAAGVLAGLVGALGVGGHARAIAQAALYCGAFVGMSSPAVLPNKRATARAALASAAALVFVNSRGWFAGWGGKLGACACAGVALERQLRLRLQAQSAPA